MPETSQIIKRVATEQICIVTGHVLDVRTAVAIFDSSGEILVAVVSPQGWELAKAGVLSRVPGAIVIDPATAPVSRLSDISVQIDEHLNEALRLARITTEDEHDGAAYVLDRMHQLVGSSALTR